MCKPGRVRGLVVPRMRSVSDEPDLPERINAEWDAWRRWAAADMYGSDSLPEVPYHATELSVSGWIGVPALLMHVGLVLLGVMARRVRLKGLRIWAADKEIEFDHLWYEPESCGLNHAYTRLGLAHLASGNAPEAIACLERSWQVHPCPHNTSFGLPAALWRALADVPAAESVRQHCQDVAVRRHGLGRTWPFKSDRTNPFDVLRGLVSAPRDPTIKM